MAKTTTNYGFPYPEDADPVDVAGDIQALAEDIDADLAGIIANSVDSFTNIDVPTGHLKNCL